VPIVFILRDPIERMKSAYQMGLRAGDREAELARAVGVLPALRLDVGRRVRRAVRDLRRGMARSPEARVPHHPFLVFALDEINLLRSQYDRTIAEVEAVFPPDAVHYAFFETFFTEESLRRFTDFAGLAFMPGNYREKRNVSTRRNPLTNFERTYLRDRLADTYAFCAARFGIASVEKCWSHF
jgi:hypothetical protein